MLLVIVRDQQILKTMGLISWYRQLFHSAPTGAGARATQEAAEGGDPETQFPLCMTREEVSDGNQRVAAFLIRPVSAVFPSNPLAAS